MLRRLVRRAIPRILIINDSNNGALVLHNDFEDCLANIVFRRLIDFLDDYSNLLACLRKFERVLYQHN